MAKIGRGDPRRERNEQLRQMGRFEVTLRRKTRREIKRAMREMAKEYEKNGDIAVEIAGDEHSQRMGKALSIAQKKSFRSGGKRVQSQVNDIKKEFDDIFQEEVQNYLQTIGAENIQGVTSTTKENVRRIIQRGQSEQLNRNEIRKKIEEVSTRFSLARSAMIARTEVGMAYSKGNIAAAKSSGVPLKKQWVQGSTDDPRDFHVDLDGVTKEMNELFDDGFSRLEHPRDNSGDPASIINCTCALVYETQD